MKNKSKATIFVLICILLWALIPVVAKLGQTSLDNYQLLFWSSLFSFLGFLILIIFSNQVEYFKQIKIKKWGYALVLGFLGSFLYYLLLYYGYSQINGVEVLIIQYSWPIFIVLLSRLILKENLNFKKLITLVLGFSAIFLIITKGNLGNLEFTNIFVDIIVLIAAFVFALFSVLSKKIKIKSISLITIYFLSATIFSFISMLLFSEIKLPDYNSWFFIILNGLLVNGYSYIFWIKALKLSKASYVAPFIFLTPIISTIYLMLFFDEPFIFIYVISLILIIIAGLFNN